MDIYKNHIRIGSFPEKRTGPGRFGEKLIGIDISPGDSPGSTLVSPIYMPLLWIRTARDAVLIEFSPGRKPRWLIFLSYRFPFIKIDKVDHLVFDEEEL